MNYMPDRHYFGSRQAMDLSRDEIVRRVRPLLSGDYRVTTHDERVFFEGHGSFASVEGVPVTEVLDDDVAELVPGLGVVSAIEVASGPTHEDYFRCFWDTISAVRRAWPGIIDLTDPDDDE